MRKSSSLIRLTSTLLVIVAHYSLSVQAAAPAALQAYEVGSLAGQLSVEQGAANYTIPIGVPSGAAGVTPELAFSYSSMSGGGIMGPGWSIDGLSAISRCGRGLEQDGERFGIEWLASDRYCLDGQRLILVSGTYGADGSEYRTETDGVARIIAHGAAGNGPAWFSVETKAGQLVEYGNTEDSRIEANGRQEAAFWAQNRITDAVGNYLAISYQEETAHTEFRPIEIAYTGSPATAPSLFVRFAYTDIPSAEIRSERLAGVVFKSSKMLVGVTVWSGTDKVSEYRLTYQVRTDLPDLLSSVQLCNGLNECQSPVRFQWKLGSGNASTFTGLLNHTAATSPTYAGENCARDYKPVDVDFDGDGVLDAYKFVGSDVYVALGNRAGTQNWKYWGSLSGVKPRTYKIVDMNNDGKDDLVFERGSPKVYYSNGAGFEIDHMWHMKPRSVLNGGIGTPSAYGSLTITDVNNDGVKDLYRTDAVETGYDDGGFYYWEMRPRGYYLGKRQVPDLLSGVTDSLGNELRVGYVETQAFDQNAILDADERNVCSLMQLVNKVEKSTGLGNWMRTTYSFGGAKAHVKGRGFLGFAWDEATDESTGVTTHTEYRQDYPFVGMPSSVKTRTAGGTVLSSSVSTYANQVTGYVETRPGGSTWNYSTHFPYLSEKVEHSFELDGSLVSTVTTRQSGYDAYGNVGQVEVITSAGGETFSKLTSNTYDNIVAADKWHLGRLRTATVVHTHHNGSTEIRKSAFNYDPVTGLLVDEIIEPDQPAYRQLTTYEYDAFGNKVKTHVSADGLTTRTTTASYDPSGRFATNVENALGHSETRTFDPATGKALTLTGPNGLMTQWDYDNWGRVTRELRADGTETTTSRAWVDGSDLDAPSAAYYQVTTQTSGSAPSTTYYDQLGRVIRKRSTGFDGRAIYQDTEYDAQGREARASLPYFKDDPSYWVVNHYDAVNRVIKKTFDTGKGTVTTDISYQGLTTVETNTLGQVKRTTKNALGKVALVEEAEGGKLTYEYDAIGNLLRTHQHDDVNAKVVTTELWYDVRGRKTAMQDPSMGSWTYTHNAFGELVSQTDAKSQTTQMSYDALGRMTSRTEPEGQTVWTYDSATRGLGKLHKVEQFDSQSTLIYAQTHRYDSLGRESSNTARFDGKTFNTSVDYDAYSRIAKTWGANGFETENLYNEHGYLVAKRSPASQINDYDAVHLASLYDEATTSARAALDAAADLITQRDYFAAKAAKYAAMGSVTVTPPDDSRGYPAYRDAQGGTYLVTPDTWIFVGEPLTPILLPTRYYKLTQNAQGTWLLSELDATTWQGIQAGLQDLQQRAYFGDADGDGISDYQLVGASTETLTLGNSLTVELNTELQATATASHQAAMLLDSQIDNALALAEQLIVVAGSLADRLEQTELWVEASGADTLDAMLADPTTLTWWRATSRDAAGRLTGHRTGNGLVTIADYDRATGQLNSIQSGFGYGSLIRQLDYVYDGLDNVLARHDTVQGVSETFGYDKLNRLTTSNVSGTIDSIPYQSTTDYAYDALGNMTYKSDVGHYLYGDSAKTIGNAGPHALYQAGNDPYVYDANGSITSGGGRTVTWSSFNKPTSFQKGDTVIQFHYGPNRNRYKKTVGGLIGTDETTLYLGKSYERIEKAGGEVSHKHFIYAEGQLAAIHIEHEDQHGVIDPTRDETRYLHRDALGSIDTITDGQGIVVERLGYSPYGERRQGDWRTIGGLNLALYTNRGFTGHEHIDEVGLIHMNGRVYDPQLGRFLSADPFVQSPTSSQNYNRYSYALNNPLKYTDPSGYFFKKLFKGIKKAFKKLFKNKIFRVVAAIAGAFFLGPTVGSLLFDAAAAMGLIGSGMMASVTASYVFAGIGGGLVGGLIASGGDFKAGLMGAFTGGAAGFIGISSAFGAVGRVTLGRVVAHGAVGGVSSELSGGKFVRGFLSSAFSKSVSGRMDVLTKGDPIAATVTAAVVGGTASKIAGGKFENGAMTAAFQYLFNHAATRKHEHEHDDPNSSYRVWMEADGRLWFPRKRGVCAPGSTNCDVNALWDDNDLETIMYKKAVEIDRLNQLKLATEAASLMPNKALADVVNKGIQLRIDALRMEIYRRPEWDGMSDAVNDMTIDYLTGKK